MTGPAHPIAQPTFRATISPNGLVLTAWVPFLIQRGGQYGSVIRNHVASPAIYDLTIARETNEDGIWIATDLFVTEIVPAGHDLARRTLLSWATALDYRRVWWGDDLIALDSGSGLGGDWRSRCCTCGSDWSDDTYSFWIIARGAGHFPLDCLLCGQALPQSPLQTVPSERPVARRAFAYDPASADALGGGAR